MDELIVRSLQGAATAEQEEELLRWREASRDHEARYQAWARLWQHTAPAEPVPPRRPIPSLSDLQQRAWSTTSIHRTRTRGLIRRPLVWAAVVVLSLGVGAWGSQLLGPESAGPDRQVSEVITTAGEMATTVLPDGSVVRLAPETRLQSTFSRTERVLDLDGRAFLSVTPDSTRPLRVRTPRGEATVLGTRFEVDARSDLELRLLVVEGLVNLLTDGVDTEIRAGQLATSRQDEAPRVETVPDPEARLDWLGNFVAFESTPLSQVARELERRIGLPIRIVDPWLGERTVTGNYTEEDMAFVLESICRAAAVSCRLQSDTVFIHSLEERQS